MHISAKAEYAVRAMAEQAMAPPGPMKGERLAHGQDLPAKFLENILLRLRNEGLVASQRGADGGYWLAKRLSDVWIAVRASLRSVLEAVTLADLVNGPLPDVVVSLATGPEARKPH